MGGRKWRPADRSLDKRSVHPAALIGNFTAEDAENKSSAGMFLVTLTRQC
jgi:hypothetical protein